MQTIIDPHLQFATFFKHDDFKPFAYAVSKRLHEGHICVPLEEVATVAGHLSGGDDSLLPESSLQALPLVATNLESRRPFVIHQGAIYLHRYFHYETQILNKIQEMLAAGRQAAPDRLAMIKSHANALSSLMQADTSTGVTDWQLMAALSGLLNNVTLITGGPGTGKTTTVARILAMLYIIQPDLSVMLAAPTGKAAARMAESLSNTKLTIPDELRGKFQSLEPATIHRMLGAVRNSHYFKHHTQRPLPADVVIVDECSMIDAALFAKLLDAIGPQTRLFLLGDKDQLASVEAGSLFGDLCRATTNGANIFSEERHRAINELLSNSNARLPEANKGTHPHLLDDHIIELKYSRRFKADAGIGKLAFAIIHSEVETINSFIQGSITDPEIIMDTAYNNSIFSDFVRNYHQYINEPDMARALELFNNQRVLCATREGHYGVYQTNKRIEDYLQHKRLLHRDGLFYENRPVMVTQNDVNLGLYNGDIGLVRKDASGQLRVWFPDGAGNVRSVLPAALSACETVFAMTIHKSQGSEFNRVLVMLPDTAAADMLTRELIYTAVTRARSQVVIQAAGEQILRAASARVQRGSGIIRRFQYTTI